MLSQAAVEKREKAEQGYLTISSWHTLGEAGLLFRPRDKWQTTDDKGVCLRKISKLLSSAIFCQVNNTSRSALPQKWD